MPFFVYTARDPSGAVTCNRIEAATREEALEVLPAFGLNVINIIDEEKPLEESSELPVLSLDDDEVVILPAEPPAAPPRAPAPAPAAVPLAPPRPPAPAPAAVPLAPPHPPAPAPAAVPLAPPRAPAQPPGEAARQQVRAQMEELIKDYEKARERTAGAPAPARANVFTGQASEKTSLLSRWLPPGRKELMLFFGHLSVMYNAGIPLVRILETLGNQTNHEGMKRVIEAVRASVSAGSSISDALRRHPGVFTPLHADFIRTGEVSGTLPLVLRRLAAYEERDMHLTMQVRSAVTYPAFVLVCALTLVTVLTQYLFTSIVPFLVQGNVELPLATRALIFLSSLVSKPHVLVVFCAFAALSLRYAWGLGKDPFYRQLLEKLLYAVPVLGATFRKVALARFCRALGSLYASGVPLLEVLEVAAGACGSRLMELALFDVKRDIVNGRALSDGLQRTPLFPLPLVSMIRVGESAENLPRMLEKSGEYYELEVQLALEQFASALEPVLILFMGLLTGFIIVAAFSPLYALIATMSL